MWIGADYYPEQWPKERWPLDAELMARAGFRVVRLAEFAWARMEPEEGRFTFDWLDEALEVLGRHGIQAVLGTPTATPPAWLVQAHPEILPVDEDGVRVGFGGRRHYCPNSPEYLRHVERIVEAMAHRYGQHPGVMAWQIDNELGGHRTACFCDTCRSAFQEWLRERYGSLDALNEAWGTAFWSQAYTSWQQIPLPGRTVAVHNPSLRLDHARFVSDAYARFLRRQVAILRRGAPHHRITTNFMGLFEDLDYFSLAGPLDFVSWDNYPGFRPAPGEASGAAVALSADLMRSLRHRRFWVMEQQAGPTGWDGLIDPAPRPGQLRLWTWQAVAHGAEAVLYFRWRTATKGAEQFWHGILDHHGRPGRRYEEIRGTAEELGLLPGWLEQAVPRTPVAILMSYDDRWAWRIQPQNAGLTFEARLLSWYRAMWRRGVGVGIVRAGDRLPLGPGSGAPAEGFRIVVVPSLMSLTPEGASRIEGFARSGGVVIVGPRTGIKDQANAVYPLPPPGPLAGVCGVTVEEYDSFPVGKRIPVRLQLPRPDLEEGAPAGPVLQGTGAVWCDVLAPQGARAVGWYTADHLAGRPAVTVHPVGRGAVVYVGTLLDPQLQEAIVDWALERAGVETPLSAPDSQAAVLASDVEAVLWDGPGGRSALFLLNHGAQAATAHLRGRWVDAFTRAPAGPGVTLDPYGVTVLEKAPGDPSPGVS
ncbi:beta-galactosidase [Carboxydochorda subterranea]|uniref:Beta-galactosidase n=1 Tax=Carboxydichorda subterranea TaxID=3109565 RepID=A0ABZ1BU19_9FIRM|nr:beta-galactosidase [Limnochorda sp. L945t]WRP16284.1 beta-galactosidase [Limnochorda sp. L945t]